jgi:bacterial leucyl aminopeptidase
MKRTLLFTSLALVLQTKAHTHPMHTMNNTNETSAVLADLDMLTKAGLPILYRDENLNMGYSVLTESMLGNLSATAHKFGRCGNYERLSEIPKNLNEVADTFQSLNTIQQKNVAYERLGRSNELLDVKPEIQNALSELSSAEIRKTVEWLSSYTTRFHRGADANKHVLDFQKKLAELTQSTTFPVQIDLIDHKKTPQKSIRLSIKGRKFPNEYIVFGGHLDSINGWMGSGKAPGADDNASGSASLLEALRVVLKQNEAPERSLEFIWYAGEESGLLGSAEIAESYKLEKRQVIAVLQLDMTLFPGDGEFNITSMTDFTSPWLREYLKALNNAYLKIQINEDTCGYGCSDHASWHRRGFPALFPTESKFSSSFKNIHTERDVISSVFSFEHSLVFSKIALVMALDLGNSRAQQ